LDGIGLWWIDLQAQADDVAAAEALLDGEERARADAFRKPCDRDAFILRRGGLRRLLGELVRAPAAGLKFAKGPHGKLRLDVPGAPRFNMSRSRRWAVIAVSDRECGVDVEARDRELDTAMLAGRIMSIAERVRWNCLHPDERQRAFFDLWTRKEALVKAFGVGLSVELSGLDVWRPDRGIDIYRAADRVCWTTASIAGPAGFAAAVSVVGRPS
jgi:4'-phosphopantetheinyl transferase